ncbi:hypothetical protein [Ammonifex thiophilus]|uniref:Uncharacterized protein n=1 Tax=Ammonifex thiophilus TaxID=444093 RepID=A0A3D8P563_9THEO|nr:hypothetical protein [Ammonifex thiophilus]RDV82533.1 hypothetical protein DXX99_07210 [Ammonifex thiophilus]
MLSFWLLFALALFLSLRLRARQMALEEIDGRPRLSPLARAILNLLGVAGGVYLALSLLVDFLGINLPSRVSVRGITFEPLAAVALTFALLQPWLLELYRRFGR